jgi:hypothetical protein
MRQLLPSISSPKFLSTYVCNFRKTSEISAQSGHPGANRQIYFKSFHHSSPKKVPQFSSACFTLEKNLVALSFWDWSQGDQMSLLMNGPKCSPTHYLTKLIRNFFREKSYPKVCSTSENDQSTTQRKQSPKKRKFAQSGHPGWSAQVIQLKFSRKKVLAALSNLSPHNCRKFRLAEAAMVGNSKQLST